MDRRKDGTDRSKAEGRTDGHTDGWTDGRTGLTDQRRKDGRTYRRIDRRKDGTDRPKAEGQIDGETDGQTDGRTELTYKRTYGRTFELQRFSSLNRDELTNGVIFVARTALPDSEAPRGSLQLVFQPSCARVQVRGQRSARDRCLLRADVHVPAAAVSAVLLHYQAR